MSVYADVVRESHSSQEQQQAEAQQLAGQAARRARDRELSMSERLERVHALCAQLARLAPVAPEPLRHLSTSQAESGARKGPGV